MKGLENWYWNMTLAQKIFCWLVSFLTIFAGLMVGKTTFFISFIPVICLIYIVLGKRKEK